MNSLTQAYINTNFEGTTSYIDFHSVIRKKKKTFMTILDRELLVQFSLICN